MADIFAGNSDSDADFHINEDYAQHYSKWREKEEHQKLKNKYGDVSLSIDFSESSSGEESEDEDAEELTLDVEKDFLKTLSLLKSKNPKIYDKNAVFFDPKNENASTSKSKEKAKKSKEKPMYIRDHERKMILEKGGVVSDEDENVDDYTDELTYNVEQRKIKESFKEALKDSDDEDDDLLKERKKTKEELKADEEDYLQWLKGEKEKVALQDEDAKQLGYLHEFWNNPKLDNSEKFLKDYILNKKYLDVKQGDIPHYEDIVNDEEELSEDEETLEAQEEFEHKYNFRFEEPDPEFIKRYPRTLSDTLRRKDDKRKRKREEIRERKKELKEKKKEEIKRLKALKRKEIMEKLEKLKDITGNEHLGLDEADLEGDFDPEKHDKKMQELFNNDYYDIGEEDQKPQFPEDEFIDDEVNWDEWTGYDDAVPFESEYGGDYDENYDNYHEEENHEDYQNSEKSKRNSVAQEVLSSCKKNRFKKSKFGEAVSRKKPVFDPNDKSFEEYFDEYYKLDFEDIIEDMPVRFKYRKVMPNNFGLSVDEILTANDKDLNKWCSVKKTCQYKTEAEEKTDLENFKKRAMNAYLKQKVLQSVYTPPEDTQNITSNKVNKKRKRKRKSGVFQKEASAGNSQQTVLQESNLKAISCEKSCTNTSKTEIVSEGPARKRRKRNRKGRSQQQNQLQPQMNGPSAPICSNKSERNRDSKSFGGDKLAPVSNVSDERLKAYGLNPKKFKKQLIYGKSKNV